MDKMDIGNRVIANMVVAIATTYIEMCLTQQDLAFPWMVHVYEEKRRPNKEGVEPRPLPI